MFAIVMLLIGFVVAVVAFGLRRGAATALASDLGLKYLGGLRGWSMEGEIQGFDIRISESSRSGGVSIQIDGGERILEDLLLEPRGSSSSGHDGIFTNDGGFDSAVSVYGDQEAALAVLTRACRRAFEMVLDDFATVQVEDGVIEARVSGSLGRAGLAGRVRGLVRLAELLSIERDEVPQALVRNAEVDPKPLVRRRNLEILLESNDHRGLGLETARALAFSDDDPAVRLGATRGLGAADLDILVKVIREDQDVGVRAEALRHAGAFGGERLWPAIEAALAADSDELRRAAIEAAGKTAFAAVVPKLAQLARGSPPETAVAVARALADLGDPKHEDTLFSLLEDADTGVQHAAARALGRIGSVRAVEPLQACAQGVFRDKAVKTAALGAIGLIQARLGDRETGTLSLVGTDPREGALSLQRDATGALSLTESKPQEKAAGVVKDQLVIYVDVDDTLVRSAGSKRIPMTPVIEHVRRLHASGVELYLWSSGGSEYARATAAELGIAECFRAFLPKPNVLVDDQHPNEWRRLLHVHPVQTGSRSAEDYAGELE